MKNNTTTTFVPKVLSIFKKLSLPATCLLFIFLLFPLIAQMQSEQLFIETKEEQPQFLIGGNAGDLDPTFLGGGKTSLNLYGVTTTKETPSSASPTEKLLLPAKQVVIRVLPVTIRTVRLTKLFGDRTSLRTRRKVLPVPVLA